MASPALKVYGHWVSQPARSVLWLLKIKGLPFAFEKVDPMGGGTRTPSYKKLFPTAKAPAIVDGSFALAEGSAIMCYLCDKHGWDDWYPPGLESRAVVNSYLSSHHTTSRNVTRKVFHPVVSHSTASGSRGPDLPSLLGYAEEAGAAFSSQWLGAGAYVGGFDSPTVADLMAYCEFAQVPQMKLMGRYEDERLEGWMERMRGVECHDDVHRSIRKLGDLRTAMMEEGRK
mmetsp:Transcript_7809/g.16308  ORF Transcript_7809/g.16308 Transcript_7809/m.16308 type:complete len:229 (-) Transcript_7809:8-694(-)